MHFFVASWVLSICRFHLVLSAPVHSVVTVWWSSFPAASKHFSAFSFLQLLYLASSKLLFAKVFLYIFHRNYLQHQSMALSNNDAFDEELCFGKLNMRVCFALCSRFRSRPLRSLQISDWQMRDRLMDMKWFLRNLCGSLEPLPRILKGIMA